MSLLSHPDRGPQSDRPSQRREEAPVPWSFRETWLAIFIPLVPWLLLSLLLSLGAQLQGNRLPGPKAPLSLQQDLEGALAAALSTLVVEGAFLLVALFFARRALRRQSAPRAAEPAQTGAGDEIRSSSTLAAAKEERVSLGSVLQALGLRRFRPHFLWLVVAFLALLYVVNSLYSALLEGLHLPLQTNDQVILESSRLEPLTTVTLLVLAVIVAPLCEEIFFRGFVFPGLRRGLATGWAVLASALVFGLAHADLGSLPVLIVIGLLLALLRWWSGSVYPGLLLHMLNNGISATVILLYMLGRLH
ncbi:CPBP family intramembrane glutamic endopeptidase [Thermogemmatispora onikobensis]|uniref:CPBP family intramembrane glutamic endopeptidase n=1 Tax=Thermogemmatispora onikobensis TaxID=732234 RepID=UPI00114C91A6|nr:CPBP family intramembrane glutamic endopeptidase [Thermogemmatispora onikobensis]